MIVDELPEEQQRMVGMAGYDDLRHGLEKFKYNVGILHLA
jgi:hypothetical protein